MVLTESQVKQILPLNKDYKEWTLLLNKFLPKYEVNTEPRIIMFLAQCSHESSQFRVLKENLNYSEKGLRTVFPKYFPTDTLAKQYARKPEKIASRIYANRMGNGNEASGDGWKYRGRGVLQTTFLNNYLALATHLGKKLEDIPTYLETKEGALISALFFFQENQLNFFSDVKDVRGATRRINGGYTHLDSRQSEYKRISAILSKSSML